VFYCFYSFCNDLIINKLTVANSSLSIYLSSALFNLFTLIEYLLFSLVIYWTLSKKVFKQIILLISPVFSLLLIVGFFFFKKYYSDSIFIIIEYILIILFTLFYFFEEINQPNTTFIYSSYKFWVIVGILTYSTGTFFFFMYLERLSNEDWDRWSIINYIFIWIKNTAFTIAIIMPKKTNKFDDFEKPFSRQLIV
jgi:hypothetical protein